jgi:ribonucleoside-diphosphate reductase alpha chain
MVECGRGEPGIFNRQSAKDMRPARRLNAEFGTNPCGEIILRPFEFCNLSIAIARKEDTYESLKNKVEVAAMIGTIQAMATNFPGLRPKWKENCEEERLLGVDINGQLDSQVAQDPSVESIETGSGRDKQGHGGEVGNKPGSGGDMCEAFW